MKILNNGGENYQNGKQFIKLFGRGEIFLTTNNLPQNVINVIKM